MIQFKLSKLLLGLLVIFIIVFTSCNDPILSKVDEEITKKEIDGNWKIIETIVDDSIIEIPEVSIYSHFSSKDSLLIITVSDASLSKNDTVDFYSIKDSLYIVNTNNDTTEASYMLFNDSLIVTYISMASKKREEHSIRVSSVPGL